MNGLAASVVEQLPLGLFALDPAGRVLLWSTEAARLTGWPADEVLGEIPFDHDRTPVDRAGAQALFDAARAGRVSVPLPANVPTGRTLFVHAGPGTGGVGIVGALQDASDARAGTEAFSLLDALWQNAPVGLAYFDTDLRYRRLNTAITAMDGGTEDGRNGRTVEELHGETGVRIGEVMREVIATGVPRTDWPLTGRLWQGHGPEQSWMINCYPVRDRNGSILGVGLVVLDVTQSEQSRRELAALAAAREQVLRRYRSLVDATASAVWIRESDGSAREDSPSFRAVSGQSREEYLGWGFLDAVHPADRAGKRAAWAAAVARGADFEHVHRLRAGRGWRWYRSRAVPVLEDGVVVEWVGTETDIDDEWRSRHRLDVLAGATLAVNTALDPETELLALADAVVPEFADLCRVYLVDDTEAPAPGRPVRGRRWVTRAAPGLPPVPGAADGTTDGAARFVFGPDHPLARAVRTRRPELELDPIETDHWAGTPEMFEWARAVGMNSRLVAPVLSGGRVTAGLLFASCGDRPEYTPDDLALVTELAARASAAVEHGRRFQQTRQVSLALQESMLTEPPAMADIGIGGLEVACRYRPAAAELEVGGDWYDVFRLPFGDLALAVGDVAGHDLAAAATMGQLRSMLRALAYDTDGAPSDVLRRLDRVASRLDVTRFTTLVHGRILVRGGGMVFRWSNAGHPVPLLIDADGAVEHIGGAVDVVLGVDPERLRHDQEVPLPPGSTLVLYTDGLAERRDDPDDCADRALLALARSGAALGLEELCDHLVAGTPADTGDDIVVLAVRCTS
ncbi:SpoIIE family protein phosphatase [Pseudonocardia sp. WMMC193]|uniref:SpoIIE family protein phosphatase n=1 Tax=Pseudonocardia sp. WMMC193 TaxID=2911965 RepID=UPI001F0097A4|nr:SpoIIE family protein phosphatase [Pseudonocardia sp. WMMC193]MCF7549264.1 SpoIIE family protein phosphatase [Pseudonocardia sp. WMMC193]